jgi:putative beta-lysine N-acetyltransferase
VPERFQKVFLSHNFKLEAAVPGLYDGNEEGLFFSKYYNANRGFLNTNEKQEINKVVETASNASYEENSSLPNGYEIRVLSKADIPAIASIYKKVFQVYPFPIFNEQYLEEIVLSHVKFFGVQYEGKIIAVSSAEVDHENSNSEMTDFATLPEYRGKNLSYFLLQKMIAEMESENIKTLYTIARANSFGMNKTFGKHGFKFCGTLIKNTLIGESIESMNVWYKQLEN